MEKNKRDWVPNEFQAIVDEELRHIVVSPELRGRILASSRRRSHSVLEAIRRFLNREIVITVPQLAVLFAGVFLAGWLHWGQLFGVSEEDVARYGSLDWVTSISQQEPSSLPPERTLFS